jgi:serpin B
MQTTQIRFPRSRIRPARWLIAAAAVAVAAACNDPADPGGPAPKLEALPRPLTAAEQSVRNASNTFSFAWWKVLNEAQPDENVFVSPLSASFALGMTMNGAKGQTFSEMQGALQFGQTPLSDINAGYRSLIDMLVGLDPAVTASIANSIWYRDDFAFHQTFFDTVSKYFDARVQGLDFSNSTASLAAINGWVNSKTNGKIPTIVEEISSDAVMYLINAIYFNAKWRERFDPARTTDDSFRRADGQSEPMRLMHRTGTMGYAESGSWQAVDLAYGNSAFTMTVVLPNEGTGVDEVAASLTSSSWSDLTSSLTEREVNLSLPKLRLRYERTLNEDLRALGMVVPFVGDVADFTGMSPGGDHLYISNVKQKAYVDVDEEGTEAAAVTSVEIRTTSAPIVPVVRVDRPYIFVLRERLSGTILFMGKVVSVAQ